MAWKIAREVGLHYVYEGNIHNGAGETRCPQCDALLLRRGWHEVFEFRLKDGACPECGAPIPGRWTNPRGRTPLKGSPLGDQIAKKYEALNL
jgi:pyruvate formate lyase activating enzyme